MAPPRDANKSCPCMPRVPRLKKRVVTSKNCEIQSDRRMTTSHMGHSRQYVFLGEHRDQPGAVPHVTGTRGERETLPPPCTRRRGKVASGGASHVAKAGGFLLTSKSPVDDSHDGFLAPCPLTHPRPSSARLLSPPLRGTIRSKTARARVVGRHGRTITNRHDTVARRERVSEPFPGPGRTFWCRPARGGRPGGPQMVWQCRRTKSRGPGWEQRMALAPLPEQHAVDRPRPHSLVSPGPGKPERPLDAIRGGKRGRGKSQISLLTTEMQPLLRL